jgi:Alpha galactosidase A/Alpha galactosidase C-terminal beta sandwich domain
VDPPVATSFRVSDDVSSSYDTIRRVWNEALNVNKRGFNGPGYLVDMDILEVGNGDLTLSEQQTHFAIWAAIKSTLLASTDLTNPTQDTLDILLDKDDYDAYAEPLANGDQFVLLVDLSGATNILRVNLTQLGVSSMTAKNLWTGDERTSSGINSGDVDHMDAFPYVSLIFKTYVSLRRTLPTMKPSLEPKLAEPKLQIVRSAQVKRGQPGYVAMPHRSRSLESRPLHPRWMLA